MTESTHAQEHWLRLSANRAVRKALEIPRGELDDRSKSTVLELALTDAVRQRRLDPDAIAYHLENEAAHLLRAAVILRREEVRRER